MKYFSWKMWIHVPLYCWILAFCCDGLLSKYPISVWFLVPCVKRAKPRAYLTMASATFSLTFNYQWTWNYSCSFETPNLECGRQVGQLQPFSCN